MRAFGTAAAHTAATLCCGACPLSWPLARPAPQVSLSRTRGYRGIKLGGGEAALAKVAGAARMAEWALGQGKAVRLAWRLVCSVPHNAKERAAELGGAPYAPFSV